MMCAECRKRISPREQFQAVLIKDEQGRITAAYHRHHARRAKALARTDGAVPGLVYNEDRPSAYDVERETSDDEEEYPSSDDWRDPQTVTLEELLAEVEEAAPTLKAMRRPSRRLTRRRRPSTDPRSSSCAPTRSPAYARRRRPPGSRTTSSRVSWRLPEEAAARDREARTPPEAEGGDGEEEGDPQPGG